MVDRAWTESQHGRSTLQALTASNVGLLDDEAIQLKGVPQDEFPRPVKCELRGRQAAGKTATALHLCAVHPLPTVYAETLGVVVHATYWAVRIAATGRIVLFKYALWDCGYTAKKRYPHLQSSANTDAKVVIHVFSLLDREGFEALRTEVPVSLTLLNCQDMHDDKIHLVIATRSDLFLQAQVSRHELAEFSARQHVPVYLVSNLAHPSEEEALQAEKVIQRIIQII